MKILGISAYYHDSAAAIIDGENIIAAAQEERFTRKKHDPSFPTHAIQYCLEEAGLTIDDLDAVAFYDKPMLKFERLLETYYGFSPKGLASFIRSVPVWVKEKLFLKKRIRTGLKEIENYDLKKLKLLFPEHHLSHAASAYYASPYNEAAVLTIDGVGEWATISMSHGTGKDLKVLKELNFPHSLGLLYSAFTYFLGFKVNSGEYKMMGLAPYGNPESEQYTRFKEVIKKELVDIKSDGSIWLNQKYFNYATGLRMVIDSKWEKLFDLKKRVPEDKLTIEHMNLALAIQHITEEIVILLAQEAKRLTASDNICLAGGVALNCVANGKLHSAGIFSNVFIQPAAGDAGGALGAAMAAYHIYFDQEMSPKNGDTMQGSYLGPDYSEKEIISASKKMKATYDYYESFDEVSSRVAQLIAEGNAIGWYQGRMEYGPRALGNRSIIADPSNPEMQKKLNLKIKYRESFRPFAPSVLAEDVEEYFDHDDSSPYMLLVKRINENRSTPPPEGYHNLDLKDKLMVQRSDLPSITHVDYTGRIQTVHKETNPKYHQLISDFKALTGYGVIINTSFNVRGEPIVCTPLDALSCFKNTEMDYLILGNFIFDKEKQTFEKTPGASTQQFELD